MLKFRQFLHHNMSSEFPQDVIELIMQISLVHELSHTHLKFCVK